MKKIDVLLTIIFMIAMCILWWLGSCYLDTWMLVIGAVVILLFMIGMKYFQRESKEEQ